MRVTVDRFEGQFAVCEKEDKIMINIERNKIPSEAEEGDVLIIEKNKITIDVEETEKRKREIEELTKDLWS